MREQMCPNCHKSGPALAIASLLHVCRSLLGAILVYETAPPPQQTSGNVESVAGTAEARAVSLLTHERLDVLVQAVTLVRTERRFVVQGQYTYDVIGHHNYSPCDYA